MNNLNLNNQNPPNPLLTLGAIVLGIYAVNNIFSKENDTVNYTLWHKNRLVYHGICYTDRIQARLTEHQLRGVIFDEYDHGIAKPREKATSIERKLIKRDRPKYNYQHNY